MACQVCGKVFSTRTRALAHLNDPRKNRRCRDAVLNGQVPQLPDDEVSRLDEQARAERAAARKAGLSQPASLGWVRAQPVGASASARA